jgi:hypothetical protein
MSKRNREKREVNTVWRDYTSKLLQLLKTEESGTMMFEESQILGLIASSQSPEEHLQRLSRYINWYKITPTEPDLFEVYEDEPQDALDLWIAKLQPGGIERQIIARERIEDDYKSMGREPPIHVFGLTSRNG